MLSPAEYDDYGALADFSPSTGAITVIPTTPDAPDEGHVLVAARSSGNSQMYEALMRRSRMIAESLFVHPNVAFLLLAKQSWHERQLIDQWPVLGPTLLGAIGLTRETAMSDLLLRTATPTERPAECPVCFDESDDYWGLPCGHFFCRSCWADHIRNEMDHACYLVSCPGHCPFKLPPESVVHIVGSDLYNQFLEHLLEDQVSRSVSLTHCPNPRCSAPVDQVPWPCDFLKCSRCSFEFCRAAGCEQCESHAPATCAEKAIWTSVTDDDLMFQRAAGTAYKKCPKCSVPIYRWAGCDHMTCSRCHHEFCFICFADWHPSHYGCTRKPPEQTAKRDIETVHKDLVDRFNDPFMKLRRVNAIAREKHEETVLRLLRSLPKDHEETTRKEIGQALESLYWARESLKWARVHMFCLTFEAVRSLPTEEQMGPGKEPNTPHFKLFQFSCNLLSEIVTKAEEEVKSWGDGRMATGLADVRRMKTALDVQRLSLLRHCDPHWNQ
jgi:hypothetical protein